jgi:DNA-binding CsgD family transcriptional regulator
VLSCGAPVTIRWEPLLDGGSQLGAVLRLQPIAVAGSGPRRVGDGHPAFGWESLTGTERSVIELVARGLTNREAGERLFLSHHTVGYHLRSIFSKLDVHSRVELARLVAVGAGT